MSGVIFVGKKLSNNSYIFIS